MEENFRTRCDFFGDYKSQAIRAAKDLLYGEDVINKLKVAKTDREISRIMVTARKRREEP